MKDCEIGVVYDEGMPPRGVRLLAVDDQVVEAHIGYGTPWECVELALASRARLLPDTTCVATLRGFGNYHDRLVRAAHAPTAAAGRHS